jgi:hypothetical protein
MTVFDIIQRDGRPPSSKSKHDSNSLPAISRGAAAC